MSFCVNCGVEYLVAIGVCSNCCLDKLIPLENVETKLKQYKIEGQQAGKPFGYPGEKVALYLSLFITTVIVAVLGLISYGLFFLLIAIKEHLIHY